VLVAGGSAGLTGAPCLAALAAARAGAGYVTVCVPSSLSVVFESRLLEQMTIALPDSDGGLTPDAIEPLAVAAAAHAGALVLGRARASRAHGAFVRGLLDAVSMPVVLDADGLNAFAGEIDLIGGRAAVLTPHEGELGRLLGVGAATVAARRLHHARDAAARSGAVVVLKGNDTLVAAPDGSVAVSAGATPALATAEPATCCQVCSRRCWRNGLTRSRRPAPRCGCTRWPECTPPCATAPRGRRLRCDRLAQRGPGLDGAGRANDRRARGGARQPRRDRAQLCSARPREPAAVRGRQGERLRPRCGRMLARRTGGGASWLAVAAAAEAQELRDAGIASRILVMGR